ncbi:unnamed protein product [Periconia digitata]|uniref:Uncharacterized protein n=1 Tax=Periconia digitata TaxID=1303443 RepID=A0A9W4U649_9PLEO|nr:unnamed protein product [Periconia digitata]
MRHPTARCDPSLVQLPLYFGISRSSGSDFEWSKTLPHWGNTRARDGRHANDVTCPEPLSRPTIWIIHSNDEYRTPATH